MPTSLNILTDRAFPNESGPDDRHHAVLEQAVRHVAGEIRTGARPFLRLPHETADLADIRQAADRLRGSFAHVALIGTGGSSLGARCLTALAKAGAGPQLHVLENPDPHTLEALFRVAPLKETAFLLVSKSGGTLETMSQALIIVAEIERQLGRDAVAKHCLAITEPKDSPLTRLADRYGMKKMVHDPNLGGRYSVLSNTGLLPAAIMGLDIGAIRGGAAAMSQSLIEDPSISHPAAQGAHFQFHHMGRGRNIHVIMPYIDRLKLLGDWFRQLTAESLGKDGQGFTPLAAMGTVDHHSMLQLFLGGPDDKFYTIITQEKQPAAYTIGAELASASGLDYLTGKNLSEVIDAAQRGTIETLAAHHLPMREIVLPTLNEDTLGQLLMQFMLEVPITALMMGIDAFDQPAVEESKGRTMGLLKGA